MSYTIRPYQPGDEVGMAFAHSQSILKLCSKDYPAETVVAWAQKSPDKYARNAQEKGEHFFVVEKAGRIFGLGSWMGDEVSVCYLHPDCAGQGLGRQLMETVETDYRQATGNTYMNVESTLTAKPFYERMGFKPVSQGQHIFNDGKAVIDYWKMIKQY